MKTGNILVFLLLICSSLFGQESKNLLNKFPDKAGLSCADIKVIYNRILLSNKNIPEKKIRQYAQSVAFKEQSLYLNGIIYIGWEDMELYLNNILQKILPDSLKDFKSIHVYPARIAEMNAFTFADGSIFFNVALFEKITNEASAAIILGHEVGHFIMNDNINNFLKGKKRPPSLPVDILTENKLKYRMDYAKYSRKQEIMADSIGFILASHNGYNLLYGIDNFKRFEDIQTDITQKKAPARIKENTGVGGLTRSEINKLLARYPENEERIKKLYNFITSDSSGQKSNFIISESIFRKLQMQSRFESLAILLESDPRECIKSAFVYYLFNPDNQDFLYYIVESLRRLISIDSKVKDQPFLTEDFLGQTFKKGEGILHDLSRLLLDSLKTSEIRATELSDNKSVKFETYGQAFEYFKSAALRQNNREAYLSLALAEIDTSSRNQYLDKYLSSAECWYKDYAFALKNDTLYDCIKKNTRDIFVFDCPQNFYYVLSDFKKKYESHTGFINAINSIPGSYYNDISVYFSDNTSTVNLSELHRYYNLIEDFQYARKTDTTTKFDVDKMTTYTQIIKGIDAFTLSPENWYFAIEKKIRSVRQYTAMCFEGYSAYIYFSCDLVKNTHLTDIDIQKDKKPSTMLYCKFLKDELRFDKKGNTGFNKFTYY